MAQCPICNGPIYFMEGVKTTNGSICSECASIVSNPRDFTVEKIRSFWQANHRRWTTFSETRVLHSPDSLYISIDDTHKYFVFGRYSALKKEKRIYSFDEIDSYEFITIKGETVSRKKGGFTRAVVGGLVAGGVGAIVGGVTAKTVTTEIPDRQKIKVYFTTNTGKVQETSSNHPYPEGFTDFLDRCILGEAFTQEEQPISQPAVQTNSSAADEILKFKTLLDAGIISEEEFQAKKIQLLGL